MHVPQPTASQRIGGTSAAAITAALGCRVFLLVGEVVHLGMPSCCSLCLRLLCSLCFMLLEESTYNAGLVRTGER